jgi:two-component system response regulator NreC
MGGAEHDRAQADVPRDASLDSVARLGNALAERPYACRGVRMSGEPIRVVLVDDHVLVRDALKALLRDVRDVDVIDEAADGEEALHIVACSGPDIVLLDLDMSGRCGASTAAAIAALPDAPPVLVLTMHREEEHLLAVLASGASGFLSKECAVHELVDAIRTVAAGEVYVRPGVARMLAAATRPVLHRSAAQVARERLKELSGRELEVLRQVAQGYNGPEIGRKLGITAKTVDTYKQRIGTKLGLERRAEYVRFALTAGLIAPDS